MNHAQCRQLFVEALYGELTGQRRDEFDGHLAACAQCRGAYEKFTGLRQIMDRRERPEPTRAEWTEFWNTLEARIVAHPRSPGRYLASFFESFTGARLALASGAVAMLLVTAGILIGRLTTQQAAGGLEHHLATAERILLSERTMNYLERSKVLLLGIVNDGLVGPASGLSRQRAVSRLLVAEAADLKRDLTEADQQRLSRLIADLEVILLQLANLEERADVPTLDLVRGGVERKGILLKINLEQMRAHTIVPSDTAGTRTLKERMRI